MGTQTISSLQDILEHFEHYTADQQDFIRLLLTPEYALMNSGRRYGFLLCKHNRYKYSFVPLSVKLINEQLQQEDK